MSQKKSVIDKIPNSKDPLVSIIIPVYNQLEYTLACLTSIVKSKENVKYEVIVVDDCSTDETERVLTSIKGLIYHRNEANRGFVSNINYGAELARGKFIFLLNNDTKVLPGFLEELVLTFDRYKNVASVGSKLVYPDGTLQEAGSHLYLDASGFNFGKGDDPDDFKYNYVREVDYCSGAAVMFDKEIFLSLGKFDEDFKPAYYEDSEYQVRARANGYSVLYQPKSVVIHYEGISSGKDLGEKTKGVKRYQFVNKKKMQKKWGSFLKRSHYADMEVTMTQAIKQKGEREVFVFENVIPTPDRDSGSIRIFNLLLLLSNKYRVTLVLKNPDLFKGRSKDSMKYYDLLTQNKIRVLSSRNKRTEIDTLEFLNENIDVPDYIVLSRPQVAAFYYPYLKHYKRTKIIYDTVDIHHNRLMTELSQSSSSKEEARLFNAYSIFKGLEAYFTYVADKVWVVTEEEKEYVGEILQVNVGKVDVIPNVLQGRYSASDYTEREGMFFIGGFEHTPNLKAIEFYQNEIVPVLKKRNINIRLEVVGSKSHLLKLEPSEFINIIGFVEDPQKYYERCLFAFYPLLTGAGLKGKVTQALACGLPVITTDIGAQGYVDAESYMQVANSAEELVDCIEKYLGDQKLWERNRKKGYEVFEERFSLKAVEQRLWESLPKL